MQEIDASKTKTKSTFIDPEIDTPEDKKKGASILDSIREELQIKVHKEPIMLIVPERPLFKIRCNVNIELADLNRWRKLARTKDKASDGFDVLKFSSIVIANSTEAIYFEDEEATEKDDSPVNFASVTLMEMFSVPTARLAVKAMFGLDGHIIQVAEKIVSEAGFDAEELEGDNETVENSFLEK